MTAANQLDRSPARSIIREPIGVQDGNAPSAASRQQEEPTLKRRNPLGLLAAKVMGALRGDKYMADAYPLRVRDAAPLEGDGANAQQH
jgi:hypothetical protein